jgi:hypothetical protein
VKPADLLEEVAQQGIEVRWGAAGRPALHDPGAAVTEEVLTRLRQDLWLLEWALAGSLTGHCWHACALCGGLQMIAVRTASQKAAACRMTPGCEGRLHPLALVVPPKPRARRVTVERVPLPPRKRLVAHRRQGGSKRPNPWEARPGDTLALLSCCVHDGRGVLVRQSAVESWRCSAWLTPEIQCGERPQVHGRYRLNANLIPEPWS